MVDVLSALRLGMACVFALWGGAMQSGASNIATLLVGRIVAGMGIGLLSMTVPLYNTEIAPPKIRGFLVGLNQQLLSFGFIVANWVGYGSSFIDSDVSWRFPLGLQLVPAGLLLIGIQWLPFSPRWLLEVGRDDEARNVVYKLHGSGNEASAEQEYSEMYRTIKAELSDSKSNGRSNRLSDLWATRAMMKRTFVAVGVQVFCQFTGINGALFFSLIILGELSLSDTRIVINYYGPKMYNSLGIVGHKALLVQGIYGAIGPIANLIFIVLFLDRVGRKKPLVLGAGSFVVLFSILSAIIATNPTDSNSTNSDSHNVNFPAQRAGIAMIFLLSVMFSTSFGPVSWVLASEVCVFPTSTRAIGTSVATCANWAFNTLISQVCSFVHDYLYMIMISAHEGVANRYRSRRVEVLLPLCLSEFCGYDCDYFIFPRDERCVTLIRRERSRPS
ncbi:hypothetical protein CVT24_012824 [Panaeolus cyanescens]|uniref:Major facilitator superfamily (MFS) profile domain-containing protein n=1 Tax=Panaeolus cyanescens TaxID=181874 RepID=A0A409YJP3_9AGAR|nr:hypothetical protein CVT24_012824 [Panaeolus cyanescens]